MTPPKETIKFAELPAGTNAAPARRRVKLVRVPLNCDEISSTKIEFPRGKSPVICAESAGIYPSAFVTSLPVMRLCVPLERNR